MFDMIKSKDIAGSQLLQIIINNLSGETAEDVLTDVLRSIVPTIINKYLPIDSFDASNAKMFKTMIEILKSGRFAKYQST